MCIRDSLVKMFKSSRQHWRPWNNCSSYRGNSQDLRINNSSNHQGSPKILKIPRQSSDWKRCNRWNNYNCQTQELLKKRRCGYKRPMLKIKEQFEFLCDIRVFAMFKSCQEFKLFGLFVRSNILLWALSWLISSQLLYLCNTYTEFASIKRDKRKMYL